MMRTAEEDESRRRFDYFCAICHKATNKNGTDYQCRACRRTFHPDCSIGERATCGYLPDIICVRDPLPHDFAIRYEYDRCPICRYLAAEAAKFDNCREALLPLNRAMQDIAQSLVETKEFDDFFKIDSEIYRALIINQVDLSSMWAKAASPNTTGSLAKFYENCYKSAAEFLYDARLIIHNCITLNGITNIRYMRPAKKLIAEFYEKYLRMIFCLECFLDKRHEEKNIGGAAFLEACARPHAIVWARRRDTNPYMPAKVISFHEDGGKHKSVVYVAFFGPSRRIIQKKLSEVIPFERIPAEALDPLPSAILSEIAAYETSIWQRLRKDEQRFNKEELREAMLTKPDDMTRCSNIFRQMQCAIEEIEHQTNQDFTISSASSSFTISNDSASSLYFFNPPPKLCSTNDDNSFFGDGGNAVDRSSISSHNNDGSETEPLERPIRVKRNIPIPIYTDILEDVIPDFKSQQKRNRIIR